MNNNHAYLVFIHSTELLNDFGKFLDFIVVKSKDGKIRRFKDYLMSWEITKTNRS